MSAPTPPRLGATAVLAVLAMTAPSAYAQNASTCWVDPGHGTHAEAAERPSPLDSASIRLGGAEVKVCYGAPSARGRMIMGQLVEYGVPWRAGANEATTLRLAFPADVGGVRLRAGAYSLYVIPGRESWQVVLNSDVERWGVPIDIGVSGSDVGTAIVRPETVGDMVERLVYHLEPAGENAADLVMDWEHTRIRIPIRKTEG